MPKTIAREKTIEPSTPLPTVRIQTQSQQCDPILLWNPRLRNRIAAEVTDFGDDLKKLHQRLTSTMVYYGGIGIAAPQIGVFERVAIVNYDGKRIVMVNPIIVDSKGQSKEWEACLSLPGAATHGNRLQNRAQVTRAMEVDLRYYDLDRNRIEEHVSGYFAHAVQHEIDHLEGLFFIDRCGDMARKFVLDKFQNFDRTCAPE